MQFAGLEKHHQVGTTGKRSPPARFGGHALKGFRESLWRTEFITGNISSQCLSLPSPQAFITASKIRM